MMLDSRWSLSQNLHFASSIYFGGSLELRPMISKISDLLIYQKVNIRYIHHHVSLLTTMNHHKTGEKNAIGDHH